MPPHPLADHASALEAISDTASTRSSARGQPSGQVRVNRRAAPTFAGMPRSTIDASAFVLAVTTLCIRFVTPGTGNVAPSTGPLIQPPTSTPTSLSGTGDCLLCIPAHSPPGAALLRIVRDCLGIIQSGIVIRLTSWPCQRLSQDNLGRCAWRFTRATWRSLR